MESGSVLVADGAWGTEFFKRGLMQGSPPDEWNLTHPEIVRDITREYLEAGADIVLTNTFGANRFRLEPHGLSGRVAEINAARRGHRAGGPPADRALVAGDIGPSARFLALGEVTTDELYEVFAEQARALAAAGVDWIVVESMTDVEELAVAVRAAVETARLPVVASMTYNRTPKGYRTMMGNTPETCVMRAEEAGASLIGANCGSGIEDYVPLAPLLRQMTRLPLWVKANAGHPADRGRQGGLPADCRPVRLLRAGPHRGWGGRHRRVLRHGPGVHQGHQGKNPREEIGRVMGSVFFLFSVLLLFLRGDMALLRARRRGRAAVMTQVSDGQRALARKSLLPGRFPRRAADRLPAVHRRAPARLHDRVQPPEPGRHPRGHALLRPARRAFRCKAGAGARHPVRLAIPAGGHERPGFPDA